MDAPGIRGQPHGLAGAERAAPWRPGHQGRRGQVGLDMHEGIGAQGLGQQDMIKLMGGERAAGIRYNQRRRRR